MNLGTTLIARTGLLPCWVVLYFYEKPLVPILLLVPHTNGIENVIFQKKKSPVLVAFPVLKMRSNSSVFLTNLDQIQW